MGTSISCEGVSVRYGAVQALKDVSVKFESGLIHVLLGQNGAGKTTLARFLSGLIRTERGKLLIDGESVHPGDVSVVRAKGLDIVHQRFTLPPSFTVADALELSATNKKGRAVFYSRRVARKWGRDLESAGIDASSTARVGSLPIETVQSLEILRALSGNARILILDEPTALLSPGAIESLFDRLRRLRDSGVSLLVILHKLQEVLQIADTVTVLRDGRLVAGPIATKDTSSAELSDLMIGDLEVPHSAEQSSGSAPTRRLRLSIDSVTTDSEKPNEPELKDLNLRISSSEILGVAGIEGNGQRQLADVICGFARVREGKVCLDGRDLSELNAGDRRRIGIRAIPFDRMSEGASLETPLWENIVAWRAEDFQRGHVPLLSIGAMKRQAMSTLNSLGVKFDSLDQPAVFLSGGNLQRLILARELSDGVEVLVAAQPTRGLDFNAAEFVLHCIKELRSKETATILMSSDLEELFQVSDRIVVLRAGSVSGEFHPPYDRQSIGDAMVGAAR